MNTTPKAHLEARPGAHHKHAGHKRGAHRGALRRAQKVHIGARP